MRSARRRSRRSTGRAFGPALALLTAASAWMGLAPAAWAQMDVPTPPVFSGTDRNGVDMVSGSLTMNVGAVSVGPQSGGLSNSISRNIGTIDGVYDRHSLVGGINETYAPGGGVLHTFTVTLFGEATVFTRTIAGTYVLREGRGGALTYADGTFAFTTPDGSIALYSTDLRSWNDNAMANAASPVSVTRPSGEILTYHYSGTTHLNLRLQSVTNSLGYQIHFQHGAGAGSNIIKVEAINNAVDRCSPTANVCPAFSQAWPTLTLVGNDWVDSEGRTLRSSPAGVVWPSASGPAVATDYIWSFDQTAVKTVSDGAGTWTYAYGPRPEPTWIDQTSINTLTDPLGHVTQVKLTWAENRSYDPPRYEPTLSAITSPTGQITTYGFQRGVFAYIAYPEGDVESWSRNVQGNVQSYTRQPKPGSGLTPTTITVTYADSSTPILMRRPTSITDARGAVTDFAYDAAGNLLSVTGPAPTTGAARPQTRYAWQQKYAWYKRNGSSSITQATDPVWVQVGQSACVTGSSCTSSSAPSTGDIHAEAPVVGASVQEAAAPEPQSGGAR